MSFVNVFPTDAALFTVTIENFIDFGYGEDSAAWRLVSVKDDGVSVDYRVPLALDEGEGSENVKAEKQLKDDGFGREALELHKTGFYIIIDAGNGKEFLLMNWPYKYPVEVEVKEE